MMKWIFSLFWCVLVFYQGEAQVHQEEIAIKQTVLDLFDAMRANDSTKLGNCFVPEGRLLTTTRNKENLAVVKETSVQEFKSMVASSKGRYLDEQLTSWDIMVDGNLASVWTDYLLYVDGNFIHCGVDAFQLAKIGSRWKIVQIMDTQRKENCIENPGDHINVMLNAWHHAAAVADEDVFFGSMTEDAIYIGTDATERWLRDELKAWSEKYFERESAWNFQAKSRNVDLSSDGQIAWFDELLDTWMGDCRGSGIVVRTNDGWKIKHYHLSIAVPNDVVNDYLELLNKE